MKYLCFSLVVAMGMVAMIQQSAHAIPAFAKEFTEKYAGEDADPAFVEAVKKAKCNVCHYGTSKKNRNAYGAALAELLDKDDFKSSRLKEEPDAARAEILAAFEKVAAMKSKSGVTFGELFASGKLPETPSE